jgi:hypothetical protein
MELFSGFRFEQLELNPRVLPENSARNQAGGPIAQFDIPSRFRWLTVLCSSAFKHRDPIRDFVMI